MQTVFMSPVLKCSSSRLYLFILSQQQYSISTLHQGVSINNQTIIQNNKLSNICPSYPHGRLGTAAPLQSKQLQLQIQLLNLHMKNETKPTKEQKSSKAHLSEQQEVPVSTKPLKSPSPDRRPANIIANTRSPALQEIKKQITPIKQEATALKILQKIQYRQKYTTTPNETPRYPKEAYATHDRQHQSQRTQDQHEEESTAMKEESRSKYHQGESRTQPRPQRSQDTASQFQLRLSGQSRAGQLDYLRLLKQKEETIKQLRELLELIDRSNTSGFSQQNERVLLLERRLREYSKQVKVLEIENQCLISVIENNHVNLPSNKEEILQREIRQLRESLSLAESEHSEERQQAKRKITALEADNKELQRQCDKLLKLMREREGMDKKESPLGSAHSLVSKDRQRVTLSKIKEQYNQNLRLAQENFENEYRDCYQNFRKIVEKESSRIDYYMLRIQDLEQALQGQKRPNATPQEHKVQPVHSSMPPHQEIESLLLQKYNKYMRQLDEEKKVNEKLNLELSIAWKSLRELEMKSFNTSQELNESQHEELSELSIRNSTLRSKIKELESANVTLKRSLEELSLLKARQIQELEGKVETIVELYEGRLKSDRAELNLKCEELQSFKAEAEAREEGMRSDQSHRERIIQEKITAIIQTFEKEADIYRESLQSRAITINSLQEENQYLRGELEFCLNSKEKETDISKISESERLIESMEGELRFARARMQQAEERMVVAEEERKYYQRANADLQSEIEETREVAQAKINLLQKENSSAFEQLNSKSKELDQCLRESRQLLESIAQKNDRIDFLTQTMTRLEEENRQKLKELQSFREGNLKLQGRSFEDELQDLKRSIVDFFARYKEQSSGKDLENYYTIQALYQAKIDQNVRLQQQVEDLKDSLNNQQREKGRLTERIANLERNVGVYQQELKERRSLYEGLLKEKSRIEKEIVLAKRIKDTQSGTAIEKMSGNVGEITGQIDKLVELERTRHSLISKLFVFE